MKHTERLLVLAMCSVLSAGALIAQPVDLSGTWTGTSVVPNHEEKDVVTLVLKKDGDAYQGVMNDSLGMVNKAELRDLKYEDGSLMFNFTVDTGEAQLRVDATLKLTGDRLVGNWTSESGDSGMFELERAR